MNIIKDKQIIEDTWIHIADSEKLTQGNFTISISRWEQEKNQLKNLTESIGIRLCPADKVEGIANDLKYISLVAINFPVFTDGRSFSQARLLRSRYNYKGEIRAIGNFMPDQVFYLSRVGVNAFQLEDTKQLQTALSTMNDFTVEYQTSSN